MTDLRIYVACLASYNAGKLHGRWINASTDVAEMQEEVAGMLRDSPCPNILKRDHECLECGHKWSAQVGYAGATPNLSGEATMQCSECDSKNTTSSPQYSSAEEFAIHDYDGHWPSFGEHASLQTIADFAALVELAESRGIDADVVTDVVDHYGASYLDEAREAITDRYFGHYDSEEAYAEETCAEGYDLDKLPDFIRHHIDFAGIARDFRLSGDVFFIEAKTGGIHVFNNH